MGTVLVTQKARAFYDLHSLSPSSASALIAQHKRVKPLFLLDSRDFLQVPLAEIERCMSRSMTKHKCFDVCFDLSCVFVAWCCASRQQLRN